MSDAVVSLLMINHEILMGCLIDQLSTGHHIACAVAAKLRVSGNERDDQIEFSLCWDMPKVQVTMLDSNLYVC